jgi:hypothetical protein
MIDPKDVMRRYSVEELNETADAYFRRLSDPTPLMSKPFTFLHEAPEALQNLGLLLSGLHLGKTMTVLDFGAGTCWLSRFLAQLICRARAELRDLRNRPRGISSVRRSGKAHRRGSFAS